MQTKMIMCWGAAISLYREAGIVLEGDASGAKATRARRWTGHHRQFQNEIKFPIG